MEKCQQRLLLLALVVSFLEALNPVIIRGPYMYDTVTKERFFVKGVDYSPDLYANTDPAAGGTATPSLPGTDHIGDDKKSEWEKDIPYLVELGVNCLRIYNVDPGKSHELFMNACDAAGIYVIIPATTTKEPGVLNAQIAAPGCYTKELLLSAQAIVKAFSKYSNVLAFVVGNEIGLPELQEDDTLDYKGFEAVPCVKALTRDLHMFMEKCSCGMRQVPLLYAGVDISPISGGVEPRDIISQYLACAQDKEDNVFTHLDVLDIYGVNIYTWCAFSATYSHSSSYKAVTEAYEAYPLPAVFSEFGCNAGNFESEYPFDAADQRQWKQVETLLGPQMSGVWSGGFAYQYSMTDNDFGMVLLPNYEKNQPAIKKVPNFDMLAAEYNSIVLPDEPGLWTDETRCHWKPSAASDRVQAQCPTVAEVQDMFAKANLVITENWSGDLPPRPAITDDEKVSCPDYPLDAIVKTENACKAACACDSIIIDPSCSVDTAVEPDIGALLGALCGYLANEGTYATVCADELNGNGVYAGCSPTEQADYVLNLWLEVTSNDPNSEPTCCAGLATGGECLEREPEPHVEILHNPKGTTADWRGSAEFDVEAYSGISPYTYQWQKQDRSAFNNIPGSSATQQIYLMLSVEEEDAGTYRVIVYDSHEPPQKIVSAQAVLSVKAPETFTFNLDLTGSGAPDLALIEHRERFILALRWVLRNSTDAVAIAPSDMRIDGEPVHPSPTEVSVQTSVYLGGPTKGKGPRVEEIIMASIASGAMDMALHANSLNLSALTLVAVCELLRTPTHATLECVGAEGDRIMDGATCNATCMEGFAAPTLEGGNTLRTCKSGTWTGTELVCVEVTMPPTAAPTRAPPTKAPAVAPSSSNSVPVYGIVLIVIGALLVVAMGVKVYQHQQMLNREKLYMLNSGANGAQQVATSQGYDMLSS